MSNEHKSRPVRQFSMRNETPTLELRRKTLKKQFSQDIPDKKTPEPRTIHSAKARTKLNNEAPEIKLAWAEDIKVMEEAYKKEESMVVKKCKEEKRPLTAKLTKQNFLNNKDSRQELAERLKQAWKAREGGKQNLNIFLTHVPHEDCYETTEKENTSECLSDRDRPKIISPLQPRAIIDEGNLKNAFQKQIRKTKRNSGNISPRMPLKNPTPDAMENNKTEDTPNPSPKANPTMNVILRPNTAASKRESFQKRTNSAFSGGITVNFRNPLLRTSSLPTKTEGSKPKFVATKRRLKRAKHSVKPEDNETSDRKGCDIVTMVSLISNSGSETDESEEDEGSKVEAKNKSGQVEDQGEFNSRKIPKSVSFQQSTIHVVRSFSASFPGRRFYKDQQKMQEKRTTTDASQDEDESVAKRRLLRTGNRIRRSSDSSSSPSESPDVVSQVQIDSESEKLETSNEATSSPDKTKPQLDTQKEKQCWDLYKKMSEKGVLVSFDTILRGMLTPTEYRLHRKQSLTDQDNC